MIRNYLKFAFRNLIRNRSYTIINIAGLSIGMACAIILFLIIHFNLSFEDYHQNKDRIYRVVSRNFQFDEVNFGQGVPYPLVDYFRQEQYPEVEKVTILDYNMGEPLLYSEVNGEIRKFKESAPVAYVHGEYLTMFDHTWIAGNPETAFTAPYTMVISESIAQKYFDKSNVVGEVLYDEDGKAYTISGVINDPPRNTDHPFQLLINFEFDEENKRGWDSWSSVSGAVNCYLLLKPGTDASEFEEKIKNIKAEHASNDQDKKTEIMLQPLEEIHHDTRFSNPAGRVVSRETLMALGLIGFLLLITACINFVNLSTSQILKRTREVGVRKVMGSSRLLVAKGFIIETAVITFASVIVSLGLAELALINIYKLIGGAVELNLFSGFSLPVFLGGLFLLVVFLSGFYPAWIMSGFKPVSTLNANYSSSRGRGAWLRKSLIVVQLFVSQALIIVTLVISQQLDYFINKPLGFDQKAIIEYDIPEDSVDFQTFRTELLRSASIQEATFSNTGAASSNSWGGTFTYTRNDRKIEEYAQIKLIDEHFLDTYEIKLLDGRNIGSVTDSVSGMLVNEAFLEKAGADYPEDVIGDVLSIWGVQSTIIGVVDNFHVQSLHSEITPVIMLYRQDYFFNQGAIKASAGNPDDAIVTLENIWKEQFPKYVFQYSFLDETISNFYKKERTISKLVSASTSIAIFIGVIGLFGLISFMAVQRTKEVGVRKVLGATITQILLLFSKDFIILVLIAFLFAGTLSYYFADIWLQQFAYRIHLTPWYFVLAAAISFFIVFTTIGIRSYKAAVSNPADSLRDE